MVRKLVRWSAWLVLASVLAVMLLAAHTIWMKPLKIGWFYERVFAEFALDNPEMMSSLQMLPRWAAWYSDDLTDASPAHQQRYAAMVSDSLATLRRYDRDDMDPAGRLDYDILEYFLAIEAEGARFQFHNHPLDQLGGVQNELPRFLATQHPLRSRADAEDYLARLEKVPRKFEQVLESVRLRESRGIVPPRFVVEKVLAGMRDFVAVPPEENVLYTSLRERIHGLPGGGSDNDRLLERARATIRDAVYPAYGTLIAHYEALLRKTSGNHGAWALPDGAAYYAWEVKRHTTTDMTPDQVHALGLGEVARIEAEMDVQLRTLGLAEGSIGERMRAVGERPDQGYPETDDGRARILADYQAIVDEIDAGLDPYFGTRPKASVRVQRMTEVVEETAPVASYAGPAFDGSRPGVFYVNLRDVGGIKKFGMRTLAYHEAIPGHHTQIALQQEQSGVPTFRKLVPFTAFSEGWALYAERLAWELGFQARTEDNLGRLQGELFRAVRLVVDTGLHHKRWSREQAIAYMLEKTGLPETDVVTEIERYLVLPGQALAYKVGMNAILESRERAETALGANFDLARFHDAILAGGAMPMTLLSRRVDAWIEEEKMR